MHADLIFALGLAELADSLSLPRFRARDLLVETKPDLTPVTEVDRAVERALRERLARDRPRDAVLGEEEGGTGGGARRWILDPVDGTKNFSRRRPVWFTLIALEADGEIELGVASAPALGRRWWAMRGRGAYADGARIYASRIRTLEEASISFAPSGFDHDADRVVEIARRAWQARTWSDAWAHLLVAEGALDAAFEHAVSPWDLAALKPIVEEAGGRFTDLRGRPRIDSGSVLTSNGVLHEQLLDELGRPDVQARE